MAGGMPGWGAGMAGERGHVWLGGMCGFEGGCVASGDMCG